jgi:hypothetical protein
MCFLFIYSGKSIDREQNIPQVMAEGPSYTHLSSVPHIPRGCQTNYPAELRQRRPKRARRGQETRVVTRLTPDVSNSCLHNVTDTWPTAQLTVVTKMGSTIWEMTFRRNHRNHLQFC